MYEDIEKKVEEDLVREVERMARGWQVFELPLLLARNKNGWP
jgi:hypothetical protein